MEKKNRGENSFAAREVKNFYNYWIRILIKLEMQIILILLVSSSLFFWDLELKTQILEVFMNLDY